MIYQNACVRLAMSVCLITCNSFRITKAFVNFDAGEISLRCFETSDVFF
jgi:hypothetical protein